MKIAEYLYKRLYAAGARDAFTVAGDFVLGLLNYGVESEVGLVCCCNELNAAYAADGYARLQGLGVVITTHSVGELSALNGVAGAYAESVPVIMIAGVPARRFYAERTLLHHTLGDYDAPKKMYEHITVANTVLSDPKIAVSEINRVIDAVLLHKKPGYIAFPADMVQMEIPDMSAMTPFVYPSYPKSDPDALQEAVAEVAQIIMSSKRPLLLPGVEILRRKYNDRIQKLTEKTGIPFTTMLLSKGLLSESHPNYIGLYSGARSRPDVRECVERSDCLLFIGEKLTDFNTGGFTVPLHRDKRIFVETDQVVVKSHNYLNVQIHEFLDALIDKLEPNCCPAYDHPIAHRSCVHRKCSKDGEEEKLRSSTDKLTMANFFKHIAQCVPERAVVIAETGSSLFSVAETMLPDSAMFIGQTFYGSIGYSVGACLGACIAARWCKKNRNVDRRVFLFVGDGSFQLTCQAVSTMIRYGCSPTIFLINNDGYLIERVIVDNVYNDIQPWKYSKLPVVFGGKEGRVVNNHAELTAGLEDASVDRDTVTFLEVMLDKWDCNQLLKDSGKMMAINNNLIPDQTRCTTAETAQ